MATPEDIKAAKQEDMVIVDNVRYKPKDAKKLQAAAAEGEKKREPAKNKARTPDDTK